MKDAKIVCAAILAAANKYPGQRVGQLVSNAVDLGSQRGVDLFYINDTTLASLLYAYIELPDPGHLHRGEG